MNAPYPVKCAHTLFEERAAHVPGALAIVFGERRFSYGALNSLANRYACRLQSLGVGLEDRVGLLLESSPETIAALLAVLKVGAAFVPLNRSDPAARLDSVVQNAKLRAVMTHFDQTGVDHGNPPPAASLDSAACVLYTSGSTGWPKGVVRTHRSIVSRLAWSEARSDDVFLHNMPLGAGFSEERLFVPLMQGRPLVMMREQDFNDMNRLAAVVEENGVTHLTLATVSLRRLLELGADVVRRLRKLRTLAVGGSELGGDLIERFQSILPATELINAYGSSESGSVIRGGPGSIGRPVANTNVLILDPEMRPVADGDVGELCISAPSLAREYLFLPELTAERFVTYGPDRVYRTGDLGRYLPNGEIEFRGRTDRLVKIRGFRVELREVEVALESHPEIREAAVVGVRNPERLVAYFASRTRAAFTVGQMRAHLQTLLPDYMVPAVFMQLPELPRTRGSKLDMQALPPPRALRPLLDVPYEPPRSSLEQQLAGIWENVLQIKGIGVKDNFVELGGDSLSAARVSIEIIEKLDVEVPPELLFEPGTVATVGEFVSNAK